VKRPKLKKKRRKRKEEKKKRQLLFKFIACHIFQVPFLWTFGFGKDIRELKTYNYVAHRSGRLYQKLFNLLIWLYFSETFRWILYYTKKIICGNGLLKFLQNHPRQ
jgi:hypothetical protein